jgi:sodium-dependent phosphate cotransporter
MGVMSISLLLGARSARALASPAIGRSRRALSAPVHLQPEAAGAAEPERPADSDRAGVAHYLPPRAGTGWLTVAIGVEKRREMPPVARGLLVVALLYLFLVGVSVLEAGIKGLGSGVEEQLFESVSNPLAGLFVGVLATVLVQSSSVSTATIVGLVAAGTISVDAAVPMIMGANIGTTVTNTLASLANVRRSDEFRRGFAAATVHDFFNMLAVAVLLPLQLATGFLSEAAAWIGERLVGSSGAEFKSPLKVAVKQPVSWVADAIDSLGVNGTAAGIVLIIIGLVIIFTSLALVTKNMRALVAERLEQSINQLLQRGGGLMAMALGLVFTIAVQSSSITTATMIPLAAAGIITLRNIYPVTLGANVGTTVTALLAALATGESAAVTVAITHTLFNITGIALFYPIRLLRDIPIKLAEGLARMAVDRPPLAFFYTIGMFIIVPLVGVAILR